MTIVKKIVISIFAFLFAVAVTLGILLPMIAVDKKWSMNQRYNLNEVKSMKFKKGSDQFKIMQITDLHLNDMDDIDYMDRFVQELIDNNNPDLIIITGDTVWREDFSMPDNTLQVVKEFPKALDKFGIPWAITFGNHELDGEAEIEDYYYSILQSKHAIFEFGPKNISGKTNYAINLKDGKDIVYSFVLLDSHAWVSRKTAQYSRFTYNYIQDDQVDWYEWNIKGVSKAQYGKFDPENGKVVPSLLFFHVSQREFMECRFEMTGNNYGQEGFEDTVPNVLMPGSYASETDDNEVGKDYLRLYPYKRSQIVNRAIQLKSTKAIFVGHLHRDRSNYIYTNGVDEGSIELVQGLKTLTTSSYYGEEPTDTGVEIGCNMITINKNGSYSWERYYSDMLA